MVKRGRSEINKTIKRDQMESEFSGQPLLLSTPTILSSTTTNNNQPPQTTTTTPNNNQHPKQQPPPQTTTTINDKNKVYHNPPFPPQVFGRNITTASANEFNEFIICTREAGVAGLSISVQGDCFPSRLFPFYWGPLFQP